MDSASLQLSLEEPSAIIENGGGQLPVILICEHAGKQFPSKLGALGLNPAEASSHIAWDIGAAAVAKQLAQLLDAPLIMQRYSRLVYDCNRPADAQSAIPASSASINIPGNAALTNADREVRFEEIYLPFETAVSRSG